MTCEHCRFETEVDDRVVVCPACSTAIGFPGLDHFHAPRRQRARRAHTVLYVMVVFVFAGAVALLKSGHLPI